MNTKIYVKRFDTGSTVDLSEDFTLPDYQPEMSRVIAVRATATVDGKYLSGDELEADGGVTYSVLKNRQVAVRTETEKLRRDTALCKLNANQYRAKTNALSNRWDMRERLEQEHSQLRDIDRSQIEIARALNTGMARLTKAALHQ